MFGRSAKKHNKFKRWCVVYPLLLHNKLHNFYITHNLLKTYFVLKVNIDKHMFVWRYFCISTNVCNKNRAKECGIGTHHHITYRLHSGFFFRSYYYFCMYTRVFFLHTKPNIKSEIYEVESNSYNVICSLSVYMTIKYNVIQICTLCVINSKRL